MSPSSPAEVLLGRILEADAVFLLAGVAAVLARIGPAVWLAPFLGGRAAPGRVRLGLALAVGALLLPQLEPQLRELGQQGPVLLAAVLAKEAMLGAAIGLIAAMAFWAAEAGGWLADSSRGASQAEILVPQLGHRSSALGSLFFQLSVVLFLAIGGHRLYVQALGLSYEALPLTAFPTVKGLWGLAALSARLSADIFLVALALAAPVVAAMFLADAALGLINRFAPQVGVFFLALPAKAILALLVLLMALDPLGQYLSGLLEQAVEQATRVVRALAR